MNRDDVIDVLTVVAAATRRTVGQADVEIWQGVIGNDDKQLALRAVRDHLAECPGVWLEPGHVHQRVWAMIRDQREREPVEAKLARMDAISARKVAHDVDLIAAAASIPGESPPDPAPRPPNPMLVRCEWCHASPGNPCTTSGRPMRFGKRCHPSRLDAAEARSRT